MTTHSVVEDFDVFLDRGLRLDAGAEPAMVNQFLFQRSPEAFHGGIEREAIVVALDQMPDEIFVTCMMDE